MKQIHEKSDEEAGGCAERLSLSSCNPDEKEQHHIWLCAEDEQSVKEQFLKEAQRKRAADIPNNALSQTSLKELTLLKFFVARPQLILLNVRLR